MCEIDLSIGFQADIKSLSKEDKEVAGYILALIEAIGEDERLCDLLTRDKFSHDLDPEYDVDTWGEMMRSHGASLWRLKPKGDIKRKIKDYRIIYTYDGRGANNIYYILGVMPRRDDYETDTIIAKRIINEYDELGLPRYG
jgi:hypothetical protein